jgi:hypothetical protein
MAHASGSGYSNRNRLPIPPVSPRDWLQLAAWELWAGMLLCGLIGFGLLFIVTATDRIVFAEDLSRCYATTVVLPCERLVYRTGGLNAMFSVLIGVMSLAAALWFLWDLWSTAEPKAVTDDFLALLHHSFARNWLDPRTWPWSRMFWAYGFTALGASLTAAAAVLAWTVVSSSQPGKPPVANVETSERFKLWQ